MQSLDPQSERPQGLLFQSLRKKPVVEKVKQKDLAFELFKKIRIHNALGQMAARLERGGDKNIEKAKKLYSIIKKSQNNDFIKYLRNSKYCLSLE